MKFGFFFVSSGRKMCPNQTFLREALFTSVRTVKTGMFLRSFVREVIARSALYVRAHSQNWNVSPSVRPYGFLAIFAKRIWGVDTCRCPSVFWIMNLKGFENFWKKVLEVYISMGFALKKNPVLDRFWWTFLKLFEKGVCGVDCITWKKLGNWRVWAAMLGVDFLICLGETSASRPCRARCI